MPFKVLVAEEDLHAHKVIHDILEMCVKEIKITRALTRDIFLSKTLRSKTVYNLILYDYHFDDRDGRNTLFELLRDRPELASTVVLLNESTEELRANPAAGGLRFLQKPYSLDTFSDIIKKSHAGKH